MMKGLNKIILVLCFICISLSFVLYKVSVGSSSIWCPQKYIFISPDLNCAEDPSKQTQNLKESANTIINKRILDNEADRVSVFYRNLSNRQWFGINENENFSPGSLLKLPLAMAYYKMAEIQPNILNQQFKYEPDKKAKNLYDVQSVKPDKKLEPGAVYSIHELIKYMIQYSDNEAVPLLSSSIDGEFFEKIYVDLGVYFPKTGGIEQDFVSVKTYGAILRSLYNASYLNQTFSNELLEVMSQSSFKSGIVAGVPNTVRVSNKFGERIVTSSLSKDVTYSELHDCGIVYDHSSPYVLCVMTRGEDFAELLKVVSDISKIVYESR